MATAATTLVTVVALPSAASASTVKAMRSFDGGVLDPGESRVYTWPIATSDIHQVAPAGVRADDHSVRRVLRVLAQWYRRAAGGKHQFQMSRRRAPAGDRTGYRAP